MANSKYNQIYRLNLATPKSFPLSISSSLKIMNMFILKCVYVCEFGLWESEFPWGGGKWYQI